MVETDTCSFNEHVIPAMGGEYNVGVNLTHHLDWPKKLPDGW